MTHSLSTAVGRWSGLGPYYAMFPIDFAFNVIQSHSKRGDSVLDPFAGRASSIYAAASLGRPAIGMEINPVGWLYGHVKLGPAPFEEVMERLKQVGNVASELKDDVVADLPEFFSVCFASKVLRFLLAARSELQWQTNIVDATLMALILVYLHGKAGQALSNQMRQGKSMSPDYSVRWWKSRNSMPPNIDPIQFLKSRIEWRYSKGVPDLEKSVVLLGDSVLLTNQLVQEIDEGSKKPFDLLFTSPPYYGITNYYYDQWLRLWMLGGSNLPTRSDSKWCHKFDNKPEYRYLLEQVFNSCSCMLSETATVYIRTDARQFTYETTKQVLEQVFPQKSMTIIDSPYQRKTQTALFGDSTQKPGEIDIILS